MAKKSGSPTGILSTYFSTTAVANLDVEQILISETIPALALSSYRPFNIDILFDLTTPLVPPLLTIKIKLGSQTFILLSAVTLSTSLSTGRRFKVKGSIIAISDNLQSQLLDVEVRQDGSGLALSGLTSNVRQYFNDFTVDATVAQTFQVTVQTSALVTGTNLILKKASVGML